MVCSQLGSRSWTSRAQRYSPGRRSKASSSAVVPRSRATSSYSARACPISFWAIEENATSSSRNGAIPVHSESRQPRISSSSAISSRSSARPCSLTCLLQLLLERLRVGHCQPELPDLRHIAVEELLPRLVVALALDPPDVHRVLVGGDRVAVELHQRAPPAIQRLLHELPLLVGAVHQRQHDVAAVEDVERLLPADLLHDPRVRRIGTLQQRLLRDDRRRVDEPGDHADVAPGLGWVMEDVVELRLPGDQVGEALLARLP